MTKSGNLVFAVPQIEETLRVKYIYIYRIIIINKNHFATDILARDTKAEVVLRDLLSATERVIPCLRQKVKFYPVLAQNVLILWYKELHLRCS